VTDLLSEETTTSEVDGAIRGRATAMAAAALVFADHPVVGVGPGQFQYYSAEYGNRLGLRILEGDREAHSLFLDLAANYGILGLFFFLAMVLVPMRVILGARRRLAGRRPSLSYLTIGFGFALLAYLGTGIFLHLSYVRYFWLMLALADTAALIARRAAREEPAARPSAATQDGWSERDRRGDWLPGETVGGVS
jgi:O-antigen ligase